MARLATLITHHTLVITLWTAAVAPAQIVINEIEYDQAGTDAAEFIELVDPDRSGISLSGWQLVLYDGTASQRRPYLTINLAQAPGGVMPSDGYLVIGTAPAVPNVDIHVPAGTIGWIQNGAPDGMALVYNGMLVELLAYEGSFVGNNDGNGGPAAGELFPDIGVAEEPFDNGLQRIPDGGAWSAYPGAAATPGRRNPNGPGLLAVPKLTLMHEGAPDSGPIPLCAAGGAPPYVFTITALPANGILLHDSGAIVSTPTLINGMLRYAPSVGFSGLDQFSFRVRDSAPTISNSVNQEVAVQSQLGEVVISEIMFKPSEDWRVFSFVEVHNRTTAAIQLGRLDGSRSGTTDTTGNLLGSAVPGHSTRIIAVDAGAIGIDAEDFRCEWDVREADIIRIPLDQFETMYSAPAASCADSEGARIFLLDAAGRLLDAVDLALSGLPAPVAGQSLTIEAASLSPSGPLDTRNNDSAVPWRLAATSGVTGVRVSAGGDVGGPMIVPTHAALFVGGDCFGRCCMAGGGCQDLTASACAASGGDIESWGGGTACDAGPIHVIPFIDCVFGPLGGLATGCGGRDENQDANVDLADYARFQSAFVADACPES